MVWQALTCFSEGWETKMSRPVVAASLLSQLANLQKPCPGRKRRSTLGSAMQETTCRAGVWERWWYIKTCLKCRAGEVRGRLRN